MKEVGLPCPAAVARDEHRVARHDDRLIVVRIDPDLVERVRRLAAGDVDVGHLPPRLALVIGSIELVPDDPRGERSDRAHVARGIARTGTWLRVLILEQRVQDARILLVDIESNAADAAGRQATLQALPLIAAVARPVNRALGSALDDLPRPPLLVVRCGIQNGRRPAVEDEIDCAHAIIDKQDLLPGSSSVGRSEHSAFGVLREQVSHGGNVDHIRIGRMDHDARDVVGVGESGELPRRSGIDGLEHSLSGVRRSRVRLIPGSHPDHVRIRRRNRDRANCRRADVIGDIRPSRTGVRRLPESSAARRRVHGVEVIVRGRLRDVDGRYPGGRPERADVSERQRVDHVLERRRLLRA